MQKRLHQYMILLLLVFFLLPSRSYACEALSEKKCCKKEVTVESEKKTCCKKSHSHTKNKECEGKCSHANCTVASVNPIVAVFNYFEFTIHIFELISKKHTIYDFKEAVLAGFTSVWLIPKIG